MRTTGKVMGMCLLAALVGCAADESSGGVLAADGGSAQDGGATAGVGGGAGGTGGMGDAGGAGGTSGSGGTAGDGSSNACGGTAQLLLEGEPAGPGDPCGPCDDGSVLCDGADTLRCFGARTPNACGSCTTLAAAPEDACGICSDGAFECGADDTLVCSGAASPNACGGCATLSGVPGSACVPGAGGAGTLRCVDVDTLSCVDQSGNACGGAGVLADTPGDPCGPCDGGILVCDGVDATECANEMAFANACGGCGPLDAAPGSDCGDCGGSYVCSPQGDFVTCDTALLNACGGCPELDDDIGDACAGGVFACDGQDALQCVADGSNACGGNAVLTAAPGDPCGPCQDGRTLCATSEAVACAAARELNACGGCATLQGKVGESCAPLFVWECGDDPVGQLVCAPAAVTELSVAPDGTMIEVGYTLSLVATATYAEGSVRDVSAEADWSSDGEPVATVDEDGVVSGLSVGQVTITAELDTTEATVSVVVVPLMLTSIEVMPAVAQIDGIGKSTQLAAVGTYSDQSTLDITGLVSWSTAKPGIASVNSTGLASSVDSGTTDVKAELDGVMGTGSIQVIPQLVSIEVTPAGSGVAKGQDQQFTATGTYDDASEADITGEVTWSISAGTAVSVDSDGLATGLAEGQGTITATLDTLNGSTTLAVGPAVVVEVTLTPDPPAALPAGLSTSLSAVAVFSDGTMQNVTATASWSSDDTDVATVDGTGTVTAIGMGQAQISALSGGVTGGVALTVLPPVIESIAYEVSGPVTLAVGTSLTVDVYGTFSDGSVQDITTMASHDTTAPAILGVGSGPGTVTGLAAGSASARAMFDGETATFSITVTELQVRGFSVDPNPLLNAPQVRHFQADPTPLLNAPQVRNFEADATPLLNAPQVRSFTAIPNQVIAP